MDSEHDARGRGPTSPSEVMQDLIGALSAVNHGRTYRIVGTAGSADGQVSATLQVDAGEQQPTKMTIEVSVRPGADGTA